MSVDPHKMAKWRHLAEPTPIVTYHCQGLDQRGVDQGRPYQGMWIFIILSISQWTFPFAIGYLTLPLLCINVHVRSVHARPCRAWSWAPQTGVTSTTSILVPERPHIKSDPGLQFPLNLALWGGRRWRWQQQDESWPVAPSTHWKCLLPRLPYVVFLGRPGLSFWVSPISYESLLLTALAFE